jgi:tRNA A37 N6-isopentenylltransferase MiaA
LRALTAVGYDEVLDLLGGRLSRAEAEARTTRRTRQLGKRQRTWFRHQVTAVRLAVGGRGAADLGELAAAHWFG